jgi:hypothetical protein
LSRCRLLLTGGELPQSTSRRDALP